MANEIVFEGDKTLNELADELRAYLEDYDDEITGLCQLEGKNLGYELFVALRKRDLYDA